MHEITSWEQSSGCSQEVTAERWLSIGKHRPASILPPLWLTSLHSDTPLCTVAADRRTRRVPLRRAGARGTWLHFEGMSFCAITQEDSDPRPKTRNDTAGNLRQHHRSPWNSTRLASRHINTSQSPQHTPKHTPVRKYCSRRLEEKWGTRNAATRHLRRIGAYQMRGFYRDLSRTRFSPCTHWLRTFCLGGFSLLVCCSYNTSFNSWCHCTCQVFICLFLVTLTRLSCH